MPIYEPILPYDKWPTRFTVSPAIRVGNLVFLSCTTATDDQGNIVGPGKFGAMSRPRESVQGRLSDSLVNCWRLLSSGLPSGVGLGIAMPHGLKYRAFISYRLARTYVRLTPKGLNRCRDSRCAGVLY
jgi:hypothetical protein